MLYKHICICIYKYDNLMDICTQTDLKSSSHIPTEMNLKIQETINIK